MSDFDCPVVRIVNPQKHSNADSLSIVEVEGCPVVYRTEDFKEGDLAIYLPIESLIPQNREWVKQHAAHLTFKSNGLHRLKAVRLRKVFSMGMLVPVSALQDSKYRFKDDPVIGEDVKEDLGVVKYEEPEDVVPDPKQAKPKTLWSKVTSLFFRIFPFLKRKPKPRLMPVYDVGHYRKSKLALREGEVVVYTEKIHGCNAAFCLHEGKLYVSSHKVLRRDEDDSIWWKAARKYEIAAKLRLGCYDELAFYGEVYGPGIQDMTYDVPEGDFELRFFDIYDLRTKQWVPYDEAKEIFLQLGLVPVPELYVGAYDPTNIESYADGKSTIAKHFREGIVIRPLSEERQMGPRLVLKLIGQEYLLRKGGTEKH
jgi:tRNA-binding EMAP/Myf-like protein